MVALASPRDLLRGYVEVSSLPMIHLRLDEAINNPRKSMADIAKIIREDPGLTARLLRIVNSAFYNFPSRVETISQAVTIIGTQQLGALALATSVMHMFKGVPEGLVSMDSFWKHSVGCGLAARILATIRRDPNPERYFVAGVLHDIGRLVMYVKAADAMRDALASVQEGSLPLYEVERNMFGFTHAVVGGVLLQTWKLPSSLEEVVMYHHNPKAATKYPVETAIVHVADIIAHAMELGGNGEQYVPSLDGEAWDKLGFSPGTLLTVMEQVERQYGDAVQTIL
ncbi:MAG: HDOD domain-containing protein [Bacteroidota bacterium]